MEALIISVPGYEAPIDKHFVPLHQQPYTIPPKGVYNVLCFPVVLGGAYHMQLLNIKGSPRAKRLRIIPSSLHDIRLSIKAGRPAQQTVDSFYTHRMIHKGRLYIRNDPEDVPPAETAEEKRIIAALTKRITRNKTFSSSSIHGSVTASDVSTTIPLDFRHDIVTETLSGVVSPAETEDGLQNEKDDLNIYARSVTLLNKIHDLRQKGRFLEPKFVDLAVSLVSEAFQILPAKDLIRRLVMRGTLFDSLKQHSLNNRAADHEVKGTPVKAIDWIADALDQEDWATIEAIERAQARAIYAELRYLASQRHIILGSLFEASYQSALDAAYKALDNRALRLFQRLAQRRLWRGLLIALDTLKDTTSEIQNNGICEQILIPLHNGTLLPMTMQNTVVPPSLSFIRDTEMNDERLTEFELFSVYPEIQNLNIAKNVSSTTNNTWLLPYCVASTPPDQTRQRLDEWSQRSDPASVISTLLKPVLHGTDNLLLQCLLLRELVRRYPIIQMEHPHNDSYMYSSRKKSQGKTIGETHINLIDSDTFIQDEKFIRWASIWWRNLLQRLGAQLSEWIFMQESTFRRFPDPLVSISGCIPNALDFFKLTPQLYQIRWSILQKQESDTQQFLLPRLQLRLIPKQRRSSQTTGQQAWGPHDLHWLKDIISEWKEPWNIRLGWATGHRAPLRSEQIELVVSAKLITETKSISLQRPFLGPLQETSEFGAPGNALCLTVTNAFGFPASLTNFFEISHLQKFAQLQEVYTTLVIQQTPERVESLARALLTTYSEPHHPPSQPAHNNLMFSLCASSADILYRQKNKEWNVIESKVLYGGGASRLPKELQIRVQKFIFYSNIMTRIQILGPQVLPALHPLSIRMHYAHADPSSNNSKAEAYLHTGFLSNTFLCQLNAFTEDIQRIVIMKPEVLTPKPPPWLEDRETPLWDVVQLGSSEHGQVASLATFMIDERDPHSYFFKGRQNRYEPTIIHDTTHVYRAYGMLSGHHFALLIR